MMFVFILVKLPLARVDLTYEAYPFDLFSINIFPVLFT